MRRFLFGPAGDSLAVLGAPPPSWVDPTAPPIDRIEQPGDRARLEEWARSFAVVRHAAVVADSVIVVQYGRHLSRSSDDPYYATPTTLDAYAPDGTKLLEDVAFDGPIIGGAGELLVLSGEPPEPWTVTVYRWAR